MLDAYEVLAERSGDPEAARQWYLGLRAELATLPTRFPVRPDESRKIGREVRRFLYQRPPGGAGYHAYFVIEEDGPDGPLVTVHHIRHARRAPMTEEEGRKIARESFS
jgi:plasmid stabilization system protein ParE